MQIVRYNFDDLRSVTDHVVLAWPGGAGPVTVYVPPLGDGLPYTRTFGDYDHAVQFAMDVNHHVPGNRRIMETRDSVEWWLVNLTPTEE